MKITSLKINHLMNPVGYSMEPVVLSWYYEEDGGAELDYVRVQIAKDRTFEEEAVLYDSGKTRDLNHRGWTVPITCAARSRYFWRIIAREKSGEESVSDTAFWETGKEQEAWEASFIYTSFDKNIHPLFRKKFCLERVPDSVRIYATACGIYEIYINGKKVGNEYLSPGYYSYNLWTQYQTWEADGLLKEGENEIQVIMGPGWYKGRFGYDGFHENIYGDQMMFLAEIHCRYPDGIEDRILTDGDWEASYGNTISSNIYDGEESDATIEQTIWTPVVVRKGAPQNFSARKNPPIRIKERITPINILHTPAGETVLDFGQEVTGWVEFTVEQSAGTSLKLQYGEILQDDCFFNENYRTAKAEFCYHSDGIKRKVRPHFTFYGFRYVKVEGVSADTNFNTWEACCIRSDMEETGFLKTGHEAINKLFFNVMWSQRDNFLDVPTDCPQRDERMGWTGDAQIFSGTACFNMDTAAFYNKYMSDMLLEQMQAEGAVPTVVPMPKYMAGGDSYGNKAYGISPWSDAAVIIPWNVYLHYGDRQMLREHYRSMKAWTDYVTETDRRNGHHNLWKTGFHYADWLALDNREDPSSPFGATDVYFVASAYYYLSALLTYKSAQALKIEEDVSYYRELSSKIKRAFLDKYFKGGQIAVNTQTGLSMALVLELYPEGMDQILGENLIEKLRQNNNHLETGFVGTYFLLPALVKAGEAKLAYTVLLQEDYPSWLYAVRMGATTIWERWNSLREDGTLLDRQMNSLNHYAYGSVMEWMYRYSAGINPMEEAPGFQEFYLKPCPDKRIGFMNAVLQSASGRIESFWKIEEQETIYRFRIPYGSKAHLFLEEEKIYHAQRNEVCLEEMEGRDYPGGFHTVLNAGDYEFRCR